MSRSNLIWLVVILVVLNAVTVATILYHNYKEHQSNNDTVVINTNGEMINGRYMRQQLGFNNEQVDVFRDVNFEFRQQAFTAIAAIDTLKSQMFDELKKEKPDSLKIKNIADSIGVRHTALKKRTADFYLKVKSICNAEQAVKLESIFAPLFNNEASAGGRWHGSQGGAERRGGGPRWQRINDSAN